MAAGIFTGDFLSDIASRRVCIRGDCVYIFLSFCVHFAYKGLCVFAKLFTLSGWNVLSSIGLVFKTYLKVMSSLCFLAEFKFLFPEPLYLCIAFYRHDLAYMASLSAGVKIYTTKYSINNN